MLLWELTLFRKNRKAKFTFLIITTAALAVFFGMKVSVIRAAVMLIICYGGELFMRKGTTLNSLGFALLIILLFQPHAVFDAGLIMSVSGTIGVGVLAPMLIVKSNRFFSPLIASICASICVLPAAALYFGGISVSAPITSVLILPFFTVAVTALMLFTLFGGLGQIFLLTAGIMSKIMNAIIEFFGDFTWAFIKLDYWFVPFWVAFATVAIFVVQCIYKNKSKTIKSAVITVATLVLMLCVYNANAVMSGRTYITIYSDSVAAWVTVRQGGTQAIIITTDTPNAEHNISQNIITSPTVIALLNSTRNNLQAFKNLPSIEYILPDSDSTGYFYDISGKFTLLKGEKETRLELSDKNDIQLSLQFVRASNDSAPPATVTIASGWVRNKREFDSDYVVYISKSIPVELNEFNAYYEPIYLLIEGY
jgi:ComEC/Rec2-related protein